MDNSNAKANHAILKRIIKTPGIDMLKLYSGMRPKTTDFLLHLTHSLKKYTPPEHVQHIKDILKSKDIPEAKEMFKKAHIESGGGFSDWLKKGASAVSNGVKALGSKVVETKNAFMDKAIPLAQKGFALAKPYIKEHLPTLLGKAASLLPVVGSIAEPLVRKGAEFLANRYL